MLVSICFLANSGIAGSDGFRFDHGFLGLFTLALAVAPVSKDNSASLPAVINAADRGGRVAPLDCTAISADSGSQVMASSSLDSS
jgi:hypothetical protein